MRKPVVRIIDDSDAIRDSLRWLLSTVSLEAETYANADEFLAAWNAEVPGCLVLDLCMPGMSGLELQRRLEEQGVRIPIIFISGHGDIPTATAAMRAGATEFLTKPFSDEDLIRWVQRAVAQDLAQRAQAAEQAAVRERLSSLTPRERDVLDLVVAGRTNKEIGDALHISPKTVEMHRARVMEKMQADSAVALVRLCMEVGAEPERPRRTGNP